MKKLGLSILMFIFPIGILNADQATDDYTNGLALYQKGSYLLSSAALQRAIQSNPNFWQAYQLLGYDYVGMRDYPRAFQFIQKSLSLNPDNSALRVYADKLKSHLPPTPNPNQGANAAVPASAASPAASGNPVRAQQGDNFIHFSIGGVFPLSPASFTGSWANGYAVDLGYGLQLSPQFSLGLDGMGSFFPINKQKFPDLFISGGDIYDWLALLNVKFNFTPVTEGFSPYILVGGGLSVYHATDRSVTDNSTLSVNSISGGDEASFGFRGGIGTDLKISSNNAVFLEADGACALGNTQLVYLLGRVGMKSGF